MLRKSLLSVFTLLTVVLAVDPTPEERAVWDKMCQEKVGPNYVMKFNADGKPSGTCEAPPKAACYWGAYKDPKTGADGCCGKDGGTFTTDPNHPKEGGCCVAPQTYTYHASTNRGGCCVPGETYSFDPDANQGSCCSTSFTQFKVDPVTGQKRCCEGDVPRKLYINSQTGEGICCAVPLVLSVEASTKKHGCCDQALNFVTDPVSGQGACCASGKIYSFDSAAGKGGCCNAGQTWTVDTASGKGECCAAGQVYSVDAASGKGGCCASGLAYKVDTLTGNGGCCTPDSEYLCDCACRLRPTCPKGHGQIFTSNGKKWKFYCKLINHGDNDLGFSPAPNAAACMDRCAAMTNCVRAIFSDTQGLCYLRTHGNKDTPITVDQYDSFHLVEDACGNQGGTPVDPPVDPPTTTDTSTPPPTTAPADDDINSCPNANGKTKVIDGIEYEFFCNKSFSTSMGVDKTTDADNMEDCVKQCSANPRCQGVNFFNEQPDYNCVHAKKHQLAPTGGTFSEGHITAIPVNKR